MSEKVIDVNTPKRLVYGDGPKDAEILIVGEAPGKNEDKQGKPFVGKAGKLLDQLLHKAKVLRAQCYVTNVVKERPKGNKIKHFIKFKKNSVQSTDAYDKYEEYLYDEVRDINPNVIIAVGGTALWATARKRSITKWRGSVIESVIPRPDGSGNYKVLPIIHPAAAFRMYLYRHFIAFDLKKARKEKKYPELRKKERDYIIRPSFEQCMEYLNKCQQQSRHAFDIEVSNEEISCISFSYDESHAISIPFVDGKREYFSPEHEVAIWKKIAEILEDEEIESVGQNVTFDATFIFRKYGIRSQNLQDTMIAQAIAYPDFPKGLDFITAQYTDIPYYKDEGKEHFNKNINTANEEFWVYNAKDSIVLMEALPKQLDELEKLGNLGTYEKQRRLIQPLLYMTELGIRMDTEGLNAESAVKGAQIEELEEKLNEQVGYEINPRSPKQLKEYFYDELGIKPYKSRSTGRPTTNESALVRLARGTQARDPIPAANTVLEIRGLNKLKGTYLDMDLDDDGRVRTSMNPVGTRTGRLSSRKTIFGTGGNLQNLPPIMKRFMKPDPNHIVYNIDLGQAENRVVAYIAPEPRMVEAFDENIDIHSRTGSYIFNIHEDKIHEMHEEGIKCKDIGTGDYTHRFWGKKANHAFNYKQGYKSFAYQVEIPEKEGKMIHKRYHSAYPGIRKYHNWVEEELKKGRSLTNLFGRKYLFLDRWGHSLIQEACAFIPQSTVADIINRRGLLHIYYNQDRYGPVKILNQVHDSIVFQISLEHSMDTHVECIRGIVKSLEQPLEFRGREFTIPCDLTIHTDNIKEGPEVGDVSQVSDTELITQINRAMEEVDAKASH